MLAIKYFATLEITNTPQHRSSFSRVDHGGMLYFAFGVIHQPCMRHPDGVFILQPSKPIQKLILSKRKKTRQFRFKNKNPALDLAEYRPIHASLRKGLRPPRTIPCTRTNPIQNHPGHRDGSFPSSRPPILGRSSLWNLVQQSHLFLACKPPHCTGLHETQRWTGGHVK